jgi:1,2-diacylglycerol 3-alpha-glucosyltransferase
MARVALLCPGLGRIVRGHETFARGLFDLVADSVDITLFKGGGAETARERVVPHIPRESAWLDHASLPVAPKWHAAAMSEERIRVESESFAWAALAPLLEGGFDVIHCLDRDVCRVIHAQRHLFAKTPTLLFSNGGAIPARDLPPADWIQEHTPLNLQHSRRGRSFMIPHGVDTSRFRPGLTSDFRQRHGIPADATLLISVGTICFWHKRMDHVIREVAAAGGNLHLAIVGQESEDSAAIKALGRELLGDRVHFDSLPHELLPSAYAAADAFVLGSLFETFGIVYIEAMAMGLPVICTDHANQRAIVQQGIFVDMARPGALAQALSPEARRDWHAVARAGLEVARQQYDLQRLKQDYVARYTAITGSAEPLPRWTLLRRISRNLAGSWRRLMLRMEGQSE